MRLRKRNLVALSCGLSVAMASGLFAWTVWQKRQRLEVRVPSLLRELRDQPGYMKSAPLFHRDPAQIHADLDALGSSAVTALIDALGDTTIGHFAAQQLGKLRDPRAVAALIQQMQLSDNSFAIMALGEIGDRRSVDALIDYLNNRRSPSAAEALGKTGDRRAYMALVAVLDNTELKQQELQSQKQRAGEGLRVRPAAAIALGSLGGEKAFETLTRLLESDGDPEMKTAAVMGLARLGDRRAIPALKQAADGAFRPTESTAAFDPNDYWQVVQDHMWKTLQREADDALRQLQRP